MRKSIIVFLLLCLTGIVKSQSVTIGKQVWTSINLGVTAFQNGDKIPECKSGGQWYAYAQAEEPSWCYYQFDSINYAKYGKLYNWYAVNDPRGLAPLGYHIPNIEEWNQIITFLGGEMVAGGRMKSTSGWQKNGNGTNSSGFSGFPCGILSVHGFTADDGYDIQWWSSSDWNSLYAESFRILYNSGKIYNLQDEKRNGLYIRCIRD